MNSKAIILASAVMFAAIAPASAADSLAGDWRFSSGAAGSLTGGPSPLCTIALKGKAISGSCKGPVNQGTISGTLTGKKVVFSWAATAPDVKKKFDWTGEWDGKDKITGKVTWSIVELARPDVSTAPPPDAPLDFVGMRATGAPKDSQAPGAR